MKILVISDSHRDNLKMRRVIEKEKKENPFDMVIHCGDIEGGEYILEKLAGCRVEVVPGNNDFFANMEPEREFTLCGKKFWVTHGHYYYVSMGPERLISEAKARGVDVVLYGHTHRPSVIERDGILAVNPGSVAFPRQEGRIPTYIIMTVDPDGRIKTEIKELRK